MFKIPFKMMAAGIKLRQFHQLILNLLDAYDNIQSTKSKSLEVKNVSLHLTEECGYDGVNLLNASDESAGQSVPHFHIHIIPRQQNDEIDAWPKFKGAKKDIGCMFEKIRM